MRVVCNFSTLVWLVFWIALFGIVIGVSLDHQGARAGTDTPSTSIVTTTDDPGSRLASAEGR